MCHQVYLHARRAKSQDSIKAGQFAEPRMVVAVVPSGHYVRNARPVDPRRAKLPDPGNLPICRPFRESNLLNSLALLRSNAEFCALDCGEPSPLCAADSSIIGVRRSRKFRVPATVKWDWRLAQAGGFFPKR